MKYDPDMHHRRSIRLKEYDYTQCGAYFITICTKEKQPLYCDIVNGNVLLNLYGKIINREWLKTFKMRQNIILDSYIIMPNHIHGIIIIADCRGTLHVPQIKQRITLKQVQKGHVQRALTIEKFGKPVSNSIPTIIRLFKSTTTKQINRLRKTPGCAVWQRDYYEHIIRDEPDLNKIREYIINNPFQWDEDEYYV